VRTFTKKEREDAVLRDNAKYAYDDEGNIKPEYKNWIEQATESIHLDESAPIIAGGYSVLPGGNKPKGSLLWTSTAKKLSNGEYTSSWNKFIQGGGLGEKGRHEQSKIGYLYKVKPNTCVLELDSTQDAKIIYEIFANLGRDNTALADPAEWEKIRNYGSESTLIQKDFPWNEIQKHFDAIHHYDFYQSSYDLDIPFTAGYDCESTAWLKPCQLEFLGQVEVFQSDADDDED
jgi:hypothetical protein